MAGSIAAGGGSASLLAGYDALPFGLREDFAIIGALCGSCVRRDGMKAIAHAHRLAMLAIFLKTLPFFALIGLGYAAARMRFVSDEVTSWLTRFVFFCALSAMLFQLAAELSLARIWNPALVRTYLSATGGLYLALFLLARLRRQPLGAAAVEAQCGSIGNTGFLGLPMLAMLLGPQSGAPLLLILTLDSVLFASIATLLITAEHEGRFRMSSLRVLGLGLLRNPMIVSMLAGFLWSGTGLPMPAPLDETLSLLGRSATPLALFAIGASLAQRSAQRCDGVEGICGRPRRGGGDDCRLRFAGGGKCLHSGAVLRGGSTTRLGDDSDFDCGQHCYPAGRDCLSRGNVSGPERSDEMKTISENRAFGGVQGVYSHSSEATGCDMTFGLFLPEQAEDGAVPVLWFLSGLTCTHENAMTKAGAQRWAAEYGVALVFPDTSPRGEGVANDPAYDLGQGAGFYVNASEKPWAPHFRMWDYITDDLPQLLFKAFPLDDGRQAITGHSMGGHGALTIAMSFPGRFASVSAFAPIANPTASDWGRKQFKAYLGQDESLWAQHDATLLMRKRGFDGPMLIDQGTSDQFIDLLRPEALAAAITERRQGAILRMQKGYDHSYFCVSSFIEDHISFHAAALHG
jgi:S-formylglutathione hydrolase